MRKYVLAISIIVIFALSLAQLASAADEIGTTIELYGESAEESIGASKNLMLQITFTNPTEDWVCFSSFEYTLRVTHNGKEVQSDNVIYGEPISFYIPPEDKHTLYIPFDYYNRLSEDKRVGNWAVYFTLENREHVTWYQKNFVSQFLFRPNLQTTANPLEFKVIQPTVDISRGPIQDMIRDLWGRINRIPMVYTIVGTLIAGILLFFIGNKWFRKSSR
ncbi:MAG: hypothetical protein GKB99_03075 [Methanocellales archaeon]|nr:hypothetical protein [Methanocellales archaeon]